LLVDAARAKVDFIDFLHRRGINGAHASSLQISTKKKSRGDKLAESIKRHGLSGVSRMTVIVSGASPSYYETATESNRRRQCGVEMRRRHRAIWRTVLPFTLSSDVPTIPLLPFVAVVVSFFIRLPLSRSPTRRPRYITTRYQRLWSRRDNRVCVRSLRVELLRPEQTLRSGGLHSA